MINFERITSKDNDIIKHASALIKSSKKRHEEGLFVLEGLRLCRDAEQNGFEAECFIVGETALKKFSGDAEMIAEKAARACVVSDNLIAKISDTVNPQGFISICKIKNNNIFAYNKNGLYIALENIQDPSNLGAISRSAEAFNFDGILVSSNGCDPYSPKSLRASMGALLRIPVFLIDNLHEFLGAYSNTYAAVVDITATNVRDVKFKKGSIVVVGNEANGLSNECISACKHRITIPMTGKAESLNVATASSILMWEMSFAK